MTPIQSISSGLRQYARFSGRSTAPEFWWLVAALALIEIAIVTLFERSGGFQIAVVDIAGQPVSLLFAATCLALTIPFLSVAWRRLHDIGWAGWWVLLLGAGVTFFTRILLMVGADIDQCVLDGGKKCFAEIGWGYGFTPAMATVVFVGGFAIILSRPSDPETNVYGPNPHEVPK
ncbi:MAG: DUF805 domain-containing protein [Alphaproteobacteria bacterium]|nr:DUF805 domain-containing protein [Alphaproteobacteria bacterium]